MTEKIPGEEKTIKAPVTDPEASPKAGLEREDAQPDPELSPVTEQGSKPVAVRRGMWSDGTGDTSGFGRIVRELPAPAAARPPLGSYFDAIHDRFVALHPAMQVKVGSGRPTGRESPRPRPGLRL